MGKKLSGINKDPSSCYQAWRAGPFIPNSICQGPFSTRDLGADLGTYLGGDLERELGGELGEDLGRDLGGDLGGELMAL